MINVSVCADWERGSGIGNYATELTEQLQSISNIQATKFCHQSIQLPVFGEYIENYLYLGKKLQEMDGSSDLIHLPTQTQAASLCYYKPEIPVVITVHDIIPLVSEYDSLPNRAFARIFARGLEVADQIIAISQYTKTDLVDNLNISNDKISVIHPSVDDTVYADPAPMTELEKMGITSPYILFVGSPNAKKNLEIIYEALTDLPKEISFVVTGVPGNPIQAYRNKYKIMKYGVSERVVQTGFVSDSVLSQLYQSALAFIFPSKYEGFGRPPLEAMLNKTPVIASNATAIPEILGNAPLYCDPDTASDWVKKIRYLWGNERLQQKLTKKGERRASEFSWEKTVENTIKVYQDILE